MIFTCHTIQIHDGAYQVESSDELALINFAKRCGYVLIEQDSLYLKIQRGEYIITYKILHIIEFNSTRKRMSILVEDDQQQIYLFSKGADNIMYQRSKKMLFDGSDVDEFKKVLDEISISGL